MKATRPRPHYTEKSTLKTTLPPYLPGRGRRLGAPLRKRRVDFHVTVTMLRRPTGLRLPWRYMVEIEARLASNGETLTRYSFDRNDRDELLEAVRVAVGAKWAFIDGLTKQQSDLLFYVEDTLEEVEYVIEYGERRDQCRARAL